MNEDQRQALRASIEDVLAECISQPDMISGGDLDMPVLCDWVLVATVDDAANINQGGALTVQPKGQWRHRTIGLLISAADDYRAITKDCDD